MSDQPNDLQPESTTTRDEQAPTSDQDAPSTPEQSDDAQQPLALIIEDDPEAAFIFQRAMQANDCRVRVINRGDEAQEVLKTARPRVVLLDLHLPSVSGVELLRQIRDNDELHETKVILLTADHATADMIETSADMVLLKPATYSQVRDLVKRIMKRRK